MRDEVLGWVFLVVLLVGMVWLFSSVHRDGTEKGDCYDNKTCNAGLVCASGLCVRLPDGGTP